MNKGFYKRDELGKPITLDKLNGLTFDEIRLWMNEQEKKYPDHFKLRLQVSWVECEPNINLIGNCEEKKHDI